MAYVPTNYTVGSPAGAGSSGPSLIREVGSGEVRVVDPSTGGEKGAKLARFSLIPPDFEFALAEHYGKGSRKYADRNWEKGYKWSLSLDALRRHLAQFLAGERFDVCKPTCVEGCAEHTGSHHLVAAAWHTVALWWFDTHQKGTNDIAPLLPTGAP